MLLENTCSGIFFVGKRRPWRSWISLLATAGYSVLPMPQSMQLGGDAIRIGRDWKNRTRSGREGGRCCRRSCLKEEFLERHHVRFDNASGPAGGTIRLTLKAGSVAIGNAQDRQRDALAGQAYQIEIGGKEIRITANAEPGLFYGVETLVQLAKDSDGGVSLPKGKITDWPDLQLRELYWDDAHHLERPDALKHAIRQAAFFKINGFVIKLEGHFQYRSAPSIVEPYAMSPAELQELTDYVAALPRSAHSVSRQLRAHIAFILKHPEYAGLRAFADRQQL